MNRRGNKVRRRHSPSRASPRAVDDCGHFYDNWKNDNFRRMILNAIVWAAKVEVPSSGVTARFYTHAELTAALAGVEGSERALVEDRRTSR
jgi:hypothetical protein